MLVHQPQSFASLTLVAVYRLADLSPDEVDHHNPAGSENVDMCGRMIVG